MLGKNDNDGTSIFQSKPKHSSGQLKNKQYNSGSGRVTKPLTHNAYKEPIQQHANLLKAHNLSLNNFKTEMKLPQTQNFLSETQFVKSPFLSKTLKGMMQTNINQGLTYGRLGSSFQPNPGRRQRDPSGHSSKSKRETSGSQKGK